MEKDNHFRVSCWFCGGLWGMCVCSWHNYSDLGNDADGFRWEDLFITHPNVSANTIDFVDPTKYYGEEFTRWWENHPKNPCPCDDHCHRGQAECRHGLMRWDVR